MSFTFRPLDLERDVADLAALYCLTEAEPVTPEMVREWEGKRPADEILYRIAAEDKAGNLAGFGGTGRSPWFKPGCFGVHVVVTPEARRQGLGTALYADIEAFARAQGAQSLQGEVRDNCPECLRFAEQRGYRTERHRFESTLDITTFDPTPFAGIVEAVEASGIRFFSFADTDRSVESQRKLYELNTLTARDVPGSDLGGDRPFEQFAKDVFEAYWFRPDGQILAVDGDRWIGLSAAGEISPGVMYNAHTGVLREYRERKIAQALKLLVLAFCRRHNARILRTNNDSQNQPMLAINRKLGYVPQPGLFRLIRELA